VKRSAQSSNGAAIGSGPLWFVHDLWLQLNGLYKPCSAALPHNL